MGAVREQAERFWQGGFKPGEHPFTSLAGFEELTDELGFVSSFANVTALRGPGGLVLVDTGSQMAAPAIKAQLRAWSTDPVGAIVYTHGHIDHVMGTALWTQEASAPIRVVAHELVPARFERYVKTAGYNQRINQRQFRVPLAWPTEYEYPTETYRDTMRLEACGIVCDLEHARGETDDATWLWWPEHRALVVGDLFIWATPNCGNPQKVQRYPGGWAKALARMQTHAAEILVPGHGPPIFGAERVAQALGDTQALLESLHEQTLAAMNEGATLDDILHSVTAPPDLLDRPYLRPVYDDPQFIVRNIWRLHGGWYDGNPARLKPPADAALAREIAALAGGADRLAQRATERAPDDPGPGCPARPVGVAGRARKRSHSPGTRGDLQATRRRRIQLDGHEHLSRGRRRKVARTGPKRTFGAW